MKLVMLFLRPLVVKFMMMYLQFIISSDQMQDELLGELEDLEQESLDEQLLQVNSAKLPAVPAKGTQISASLTSFSSRSKATSQTKEGCR